MDWLRGLAVVLMILWHVFDSWSTTVARSGPSFKWIAFMGGIPSRLFLLLVGVSIAIKFEAQIAKHVDHRTIMRGTAKRGLEILALAYLFRFQEYALSGFGWNWRDLFTVDILNSIGASMIVAAFVSAPRGGRPQIAVTLVAAAAFLALGPVIGPARFPPYLTRAVTAYFGGTNAGGGVARFPLFPWAAWALVGVAVGHYWVRQSRNAKRLAIAFLLTGIAGVALINGVNWIRQLNPYIIRYPSPEVQQLGPGAFLYRLGWMGVISLLAYVVTLATPKTWFSPMRQFGRTSLLVYWIHVDLCYGVVLGRLHKRLTLGQAAIGFAAMTGLMLVISVLKTKYWRGMPRVRRRGTGPAVSSTPKAA